MAATERLPVASDEDVVAVRSRARELAAELGLSRTDQTVVTTAVSEVARNIVSYAGYGDVSLSVEQRAGRWALVIVARDDGPGIADVGLALNDGYSTAGGLGVGLSGARRLMDSLEVASEVGQGTTVTMVKWSDRRG